MLFWYDQDKNWYYKPKFKTSARSNWEYNCNPYLGFLKRLVEQATAILIPVTTIKMSWRLQAPELERLAWYFLLYIRNHIFKNNLKSIVHSKQRKYWFPCLIENKRFLFWEFIRAPPSQNQIKNEFLRSTCISNSLKCTTGVTACKHLITFQLNSHSHFLATFINPILHKSNTRRIDIGVFFSVSKIDQGFVVIFRLVDVIKFVISENIFRFRYASYAFLCLLSIFIFFCFPLSLIFGSIL